MLGVYLLPHYQNNIKAGVLLIVPISSDNNKCLKTRLGNVVERCTTWSLSQIPTLPRPPKASEVMKAILSSLITVPRGVKVDCRFDPG